MEEPEEHHGVRPRKKDSKNKGKTCLSVQEPMKPKQFNLSTAISQLQSLQAKLFEPWIREKEHSPIKPFWKKPKNKSWWNQDFFLKKVLLQRILETMNQMMTSMNTLNRQLQVQAHTCQSMNLKDSQSNPPKQELILEPVKGSKANPTQTLISVQVPTKI